MAVRGPSLQGAPTGVAAWTVGPGSSPQAALEAVRRAAAQEMAQFDPVSVRAWQRLDSRDQLWLAGTFVIVGLCVVMADGKVEPGELERVFLKTDILAARTRSYTVNWAIGIMSDRDVLKAVFSGIFDAPSADPAFELSRAALAKLPEPDRCRMTVALYSMGWHAITAKDGAPPTPETIELRQLCATIARLGLDLSTSVAWAKENGP